VTISPGVLMEIILMIGFGRVKSTGRENFSYHWVFPGARGFKFGENAPSFGALFRTRYKNC